MQSPRSQSACVDMEWMFEDGQIEIFKTAQSRTFLLASYFAGLDVGSLAQRLDLEIEIGSERQVEYVKW